MAELLARRCFVKLDTRGLQWWQASPAQAWLLYPLFIASRVTVACYLPYYEEVLPTLNLEPMCGIHVYTTDVRVPRIRARVRDRRGCILCMCVYMHIMYMCVYVSTYSLINHLYVCICVYLYMGTYVIYVFMYIRICIYIQIHIHRHL